MIKYYIDTRVKTESDRVPQYHSSFWYGYRTLDDGPGTDAFQKCLRVANENGYPMPKDTDTTDNPQYIQSMIVTDGSFQVPGFVYGFKTPIDGPNDGFFNNCLEYIKKTKVDVTLADGTIIKNRNRPMMLIFGENDSRRLSDLAQGINLHPTSSGPAIKRTGMLNLQFILKINKTEPSESVVALDFIKQKTQISDIGKSFIMTYGVFEDGTEFIRYGSLIKDDTSDRTEAFLNVFGTGLNGTKQGLAYQWQKEWDELYESHKKSSPLPQPISNPKELQSGFVRCESGNTPMIMSSDKIVPGGHFYGYLNKTIGPGDTAFQQVKDAAKQYKVPILMVLDVGAQVGSDWCGDANDGTDYGGGRYLTQKYNEWKDKYGDLLCYFRGDMASPTATKEAWEFAIQNGIDCSNGLVLILFYYKGDTLKVFGQQMTSSIETFKLKGDQYLSQWSSDSDTEKEVKMTTQSEIDTSIVFNPTNNIDAIKNCQKTFIVDVNSVSYSKGHPYHTYQEAYDNFVYLTDCGTTLSTFNYNVLIDDKMQSVKEPYLSTSIQTRRYLLGHPNSSIEKDIYKDDDGQFYGTLSAVLERNDGIFLYISDNTSFNANDAIFNRFQIQLGQDTGIGLYMLNKVGKIFSMGYRLRWDSKNNTYKTYSRKSAVDAYTFLLEKTGQKNKDVLNDPLYMFYGKTSDGREIIKYGSFSAESLKQDKRFKPTDLFYYADYLGMLATEYIRDFTYEQSKCITNINNSKRGFYSNSSFVINRQLDTLNDLRTGLWYSPLFYCNALMQISENTDTPVIFYTTYSSLVENTMPNNMEDIKWQPTEQNKLIACYNSIIGFMSQVIFGAYGSYSANDYSYVDSRNVEYNALREYLVNSGCILCKGDLDDNFYDMVKDIEKTVYRYVDIEIIICKGFQGLKKIKISEILNNLGLGQIFGQSAAMLGPKCPHVNYLNTITYKTNDVIYNDIETGTTWWHDNKEKIRNAIIDEIKSVLGELTVTFLDYDGTIIKVQKNIKSGQSANPPQNPSREGYNFTKWEPTFTNITADLTCVAQYQQIESKTYQNNMREQLTNVKLSKNILSVGDYCFYNCYKLKDVQLGDYCRMIGTSAFKDCIELTNVNRLNDNNSDHTFDVVGDYAFSNTNLSSITLSLRGSSSFTFWGDYCFAYNKNLQNVRFLSSSFMSNNMFCDCSSLTSVTFANNYTSYVYPYVFHNCTQLKDITLPSKIWFVSNGMFKGCSSLSSLKFSSYDNSVLNLIQDGAFNGCSSLTSIEFPQSINSLSCLEDGCFQNMPNLMEIKFDGILSDELMIDGITEIEEDFYYGVRYERSKSDDVLKLIDLADKNNIPIVLAMRKPSGCSNCTKFADDIKSKNGQNDLAKHRILMVDYTSDYRTDDEVHSKFEDSEGIYEGQYVFCGIYWRKSDGTLKKYTYPSFTKWIDGMNKTVEKILTKWGYDWKLTEEEKAIQTKIAVEPIKRTGCFRLNHDCVLISKEGNSINFTYNPKEVEQKVESSNYESDKNTKNNFQVGKWYYNMKQLKQYADQTEKPILGIYSLLGCEPCTIYHENIWNNDTLQTWISSQNFYFCGIESQRQTYYDDQLNYCVNDFVISADNYLRYGEDITTIKYNAFGEYFKETKNGETGQKNTNLFTPVIMMYNPTNRVNSEGSFYLYTYHEIQKWINQCGKDGVVEILKRLCLYHFENNDTSSPNGFVRGVTVKFDINNLPNKSDVDKKNRYYDETTEVMDLGSYGSIDKLKQNLKNTFKDDNGEYIGGCQVEQVPWMNEIGIDAEIATNYPQQMKEILEKVKIYRFTDSEKYTVKLDINDTVDVYSPCSVSGYATGYKLIWSKM